MVLQISLFYSQNLQVQPKVTIHWRLQIKLNQVKSNRMKCFEPGEKNSESRVYKQQIQTKQGVESGIEPRPHLWKAIAFTTAPIQLPAK